MLQFYKYIIYRLYSSALDKRSLYPVLDVIWTIAFVHMTQIATIYALLLWLIPGVPLFTETKGVVFVFCLCMLVGHYFIFYNKEKWNGIMEEFKDEAPGKKIKGRWRVSIYIFGWPILCFIVILLASLANT
ncbi:hypothetical protein [Chitinophaga arvensicola]|uniref:Uncharacterized protein n=1 Tax=Chitinophaga arvensicola TaxID=29529 RepID=A0A1I0S761_9BACT|nr:hypothetical protein [Chitinophaga arvensicola]SEW51584.1 hypothetical protein SAMN04488122_4342 [Chitinophaga arvensicola]